jgi:hypothetical protein
MHLPAKDFVPPADPAEHIQGSQPQACRPLESDAEHFQRVFGGVRIDWTPGAGEAAREAASEPLLLVGADFDGQMVAFAGALQACMERVAPTTKGR